MISLFTKSTPGAAAARKLADADARARAAVDRLTELHRRQQQAAAKLAELEVGDLSGDIEQAAGAYARAHSELTATVSFCRAAKGRVRSELEAARRDALEAERQAAAEIGEHFRSASAARVRKLADSLLPELETLAAELSRRNGSVITLSALVAELEAELENRVGSGWAMAPGRAVDLTPKVPAAPRSETLTGDHRNGRHLDLIGEPIDARAVRQNLQAIDRELEDALGVLRTLDAHDAGQSRRRASLQELVDRCRATRAELELLLEQAEQQQAMAA